MKVVHTYRVVVFRAVMVRVGGLGVSSCVTGPAGWRLSSSRARVCCCRQSSCVTGPAGRSCARVCSHRPSSYITARGALAFQYIWRLPGRCLFLPVIYTRIFPGTFPVLFWVCPIIYPRIFAGTFSVLFWVCPIIYTRILPGTFPVLFWVCPIPSSICCLNAFLSQPIINFILGSFLAHTTHTAILNGYLVTSETAPVSPGK